jgi:hypothetical protein
MTGTTIPSDLQAHRERGMRLTGLGGVDWGIAPNEAHKSGGGYHCGCKDCQNIGKFHPPATSHVGADTEDYSVRQLRDRVVGGNAASAEDIGDDWPNGGRAAWLRFNNLLVKQCRAHDPDLSAIREVNFSPDGTARKRWDALHPEAGIVNSTDTVYMHTHVGFWRDTAGTAARARTLARIEQIISAAVNNRPLAGASAGEDEDDMGQSFTLQVPPAVELEGTSFTFSPGLVAGGIADPRPTWVSFGADTWGAKFAIRAMQTNGVKDKDGNVSWSAVFSADSVVVASGERATAQLKTGTVWVSVTHQAIDKDDKPVDPKDKAAVAVWHGAVAVLVERGAVAH